MYKSNTMVAFPYSSIGKFASVLSVATQAFGVNDSTFVAITSLLAAASDETQINVVAFSGGAAAFTNAVNFLNKAGLQSVTALIGNITYVSPGTFFTPLYNNGNTAVLLGNSPADALATGSSMFGLLGVTPQIAWGCDHDYSCIAGYFSTFLQMRSGSACSTPTIFDRSNYSNQISTPGSASFYILNLISRFFTVTSTITYPPAPPGPEVPDAP